jgi:hypothetical protein
MNTASGLCVETARLILRTVTGGAIVASVARAATPLAAVRARRRQAGRFTWKGCFVVDKGYEAVIAALGPGPASADSLFSPAGDADMRPGTGPGELVPLGTER